MLFYCPESLFSANISKLFLMHIGQAAKNILKQKNRGKDPMDNIDLKKLKDVEIQSVEKDSLVDLKDVTIDTSLERSERLSDFLSQIKNPYCFVCDGVIVKIRFAETGDTLEEKLNEYFS